MPKKPMRSAIAIALTLAVMALSMLVGGTAGSRASVAAAPRGNYQEIGISPQLAAAALNTLSNQVDGRAARQMTNVHFILNWLPNVEFAGIWLAEKYGWFNKAGIHMTFTPYSLSVHPETDVPQRGGNTFGFQSGAAIIQARATGVPDTALYTDTQRSVFGLTVLAKSKIYKITDLRGKRVGYQPHELYVPETMLAYAGLKQSEWKPVQVGFDIAQLTAGQVDAYLTFQTNEPIALALQGVKTRSFKAADYGFHFYDDVLFTYDGLIKSKPALVRTVVSLLARGFRMAHMHPDAAARLTVKYYFPASAGGTTAAKNLQQQLMEMRAFSPFSRDSRGGFSGTMTATQWQQSINTLYRYGEIKSKPAASAMFTNRFNPY
jgi:ABC-type nitrate/sulfonate/bicarbonate transport system substrate-binding protein